MDFLYQFISEDLIYALGWTVIHSLWQALIIGVLMAFAMFYLKNKSAKVRYEIAAFSQFMVFISALSTFLIYYAGSLQLKNFAHLTEIEVQQLAALAQQGLFTESMLQTCIKFFNNHIPVVVMVWMLGASFFLVRMLGGLIYVQHLRYNKNQAVPAYWNNKLKTLKSRIRLRKKVKLLESAIATVPMVIGYIKPVILLPIGAINSLNEGEVEAILAHELAHIRRNDYLINIFLSVIEVLFYFNPAVWWISANIRTERENCCDDTAVQLCGSSLTYAKALVSLQEIGHSGPSMAMTFAGPKNQLLHRVKRVLNQPQNKSNIMEKMTATLLLLFTVVLFSVGANGNLDYNAANELTPAEIVEEATASPSEGPKPVRIESLKIAPIPEPKRVTERKRYVNTTDDGQVEIELEDGIIVKLSINGSEVSKNEFSKYRSLIDDMLVDMNMMPGVNKSEYADQYLNAPDFQHKKTIRKERNGQTHIVIQSEGQQPTEIIIEGEDEFIVIDGNRYEDGDTAVIVDRRTTPTMNGAKTFEYSRIGNSYHPDLEEITNLSWKDLKQLENRLTEMEASKKLWDKAYTQRWTELEKNWNRLEQLSQNLAQQQAQITSPELIQKQKILNTKIKELEKRRTLWIEAQSQWHKTHEKEKNQLSQQLLNSRSLNKNKKSSCNSSNKKKKKSSSFNKTTSTNKDEASINHSDPFELNSDGFYNFNNQIKHHLENELVEDLLITSKNDYSFELNNRRLKINGEKQKHHFFKKYLNLYESLTGIEMNGAAQIIIQNRNGHSNTNYYHSSNLKETDTRNSFSCISHSDGTFFITAPDSLNHENEIILASIEFPNTVELTGYLNIEMNADNSGLTKPLTVFLSGKTSNN